MVMAAGVVVRVLMAVELELQDILGMVAMVLKAMLMVLLAQGVAAVAAQRKARLLVVAPHGMAVAVAV
jgi:hypothetical protein